jgi:hypothetical protein
LLRKKPRLPKLLLRKRLKLPKLLLRKKPKLPKLLLRKRLKVRLEKVIWSTKSRMKCETKEL